MFAAVLALVVMEPLGWHWYLGLASAPLALVLILFLVRIRFCDYWYCECTQFSYFCATPQFVPESSWYYIASGKIDKAEAVLRTVAKYNCKTPPKVGDLSSTVSSLLFVFYYVYVAYYCAWVSCLVFSVRSLACIWLCMLACLCSLVANYFTSRELAYTMT